MQNVGEFLERLDQPTRAMIDRLRAVVLSAHPALIERIKWNAPSFAIDGDDRLTLGIERKGGVRLVLHRGAKPRPTDTFVFDDPDALAAWPAPDRGVIVCRDLATVERLAEPIKQLCRRWIAIR